MCFPFFILAGFGEDTPQQDFMRVKCVIGEIWTHGRILLLTSELLSIIELTIQNFLLFLFKFFLCQNASIQQILNLL